jgi:hypothetical protein
MVFIVSFFGDGLELLETHLAEGQENYSKAKQSDPNMVFPHNVFKEAG